MAFGGVDTGIMNPILPPRVAPRAGSSGATPAACDTAMAIGIIMFAAAGFALVHQPSKRRAVMRVDFEEAGMTDTTIPVVTR